MFKFKAIIQILLIKIYFLSIVQSQRDLIGNINIMRFNLNYILLVTLRTPL